MSAAEDGSSGGGGGWEGCGALVPSIPPRLEDIWTASVPPYQGLRWGASAAPPRSPPPFHHCIALSLEEGEGPGGRGGGDGGAGSRRKQAKAHLHAGKK